MISLSQCLGSLALLCAGVDGVRVMHKNGGVQANPKCEDWCWGLPERDRCMTLECYYCRGCGGNPTPAPPPPPPSPPAPTPKPTKCDLTKCELSQGSCQLSQCTQCPWCDSSVALAEDAGAAHKSDGVQANWECEEWCWGLPERERCTTLNCYYCKGCGGNPAPPPPPTPPPAPTPKPANCDLTSCEFSPGSCQLTHCTQCPWCDSSVALAEDAGAAHKSDGVQANP